MDPVDIVNPLIAPLSALAGVGLGGWLTHHWSAKRDLANEQRRLRVAWTTNLADRIPEIIKTAGWFYLSSMNGSTPPNSENDAWSAEKTSQTLTLVYQIAQVELMLDLEDKTHVAIRQAMNDVRSCAFARGERLIQFESAVDNLKKCCSIARQLCRSPAIPYFRRA